MKTRMFLTALIMLCSCSVEPTKTVIEAETLDQARAEAGNETISNWEFGMANLQKIPVFPVGTTIDQVEDVLVRMRVKILSQSTQEIIVRGRKRSNLGGATITIADADSFVYRFRESKLESGPNIVKED